VTHPSASRAVIVPLTRETSMPTDSLASAPPALWAVIAPLVAFIPAVLCMIDISRHPNTRQLTPQAWLAICAFGNVFGLIAYLRLGRSDDR
jgi:hypothetical protein